MWKSKIIMSHQAMDPNFHKRVLIFNQNSKLEDSFAPNNSSTRSNFGQAKQNQAIHVQIKIRIHSILRHPIDTIG